MDDLKKVLVDFLTINNNDHNYNDPNNYNINFLKEEIKLKIYEIISLSYIRVNGGIDTFLQLCGCISKIYIYIQNEY